MTVQDGRIANCVKKMEPPHAVKLEQANTFLGNGFHIYTIVASAEIDFTLTKSLSKKQRDAFNLVGANHLKGNSHVLGTGKLYFNF